MGNMISRCIVLALLCVSMAARAATIEQLFSNVAFLSVNGSPPTGTGFLLNSKGVSFLVTANHIAEFMIDKTTVTVGQGANLTPTNVALSDIRSRQIGWVRHAKANADVAVLPLEIPRRLQSLFAGKFLNESNLWKVLPGRNTVLTVIGFPKGLGVGSQFAPLSRESKAASSIVNISWNGGVFTGFLLDKGTIGGYSGSPVFDLQYTLYVDGAIAPDRDSPVRVLGLVQGFVEDMTAVVPASMIREAISDAHKKLRP